MTFPSRILSTRTGLPLRCVLAGLALSACATSSPPIDAPRPKVVAAERLQPLTRFSPVLRLSDFQQTFPGGTAIIRVEIDAEGRVRDVRIDETSGNALMDAAAAQSLVGARFIPYREGGVALPVTTLVPVRFPRSNCIIARPLDC